MPYANDKQDKEYHRLYALSPKGKAANKLQSLKHQAWVTSLKNKPCMDCGGWFNTWQMDFDHRDRTAKRDTIGNLRSCSKRIILEEMKKCDLVCANCHRDRTHKRKDYLRGIHV